MTKQNANKTRDVFLERKNQEGDTISNEAAIRLFIIEMNKKARQIGLKHSHFVEPAGFPSTIEQVMTTRDMLKLLIYASGYSKLTAIWNQKSYTMKIRGKEPREITVQTTVKLPAIEDEYEMLGAKTGEIWGTNEIDGFHIALLVGASNGKQFAAALRGASSPAKRAKDIKTALENAKLLMKDPAAKVEEISSESAAVCLLPEQFEIHTEHDVSLIYDKNADLPGHPASITKILTAIIALDYFSDLDEKIILQETDITPGTGDYFYPGDILTLKDLLYGMMLPSSNTCATAAARFTGEKIYEQMSCRDKRTEV